MRISTEQDDNFRKHLYVAAGMPRSGSTWLYNALRLLLRDRSLYSCWFDEFDQERADRASVILVKIHGVNPELASEAKAIFTCHRDLRDIAISVRDMGWIESEEDWLDRIKISVKEHEFWAPLSRFDFSYEDITQKPFQTLYKLSRSINPARNNFRRFWSVWCVQRELNSLPEAESDKILHHPETLLHYKHRRARGVSRWRTQLASNIVVKIETQHKDWLSRMGYL